MRLTPNSESLREFNTCHAPAGSPVGGRFCAKTAAEAIRTSSPAFKAWFGKSQVVDEKGYPLRAFHGTTADFDTFDTQPKRESPNRNWMGDLGAWFTAPSKYQGNYDEENAEFMAGDYTEGEDEETGKWGPRPGARIKPVYLSIQNPMEYADYDEFQDARGQSMARGAALRRYLIRKGYDGVVIRNSMTDGDVDRDDWIAFHPEQIKSAIGNKGTWSRKSKNITEAQL